MFWDLDIIFWGLLIVISLYNMYITNKYLDTDRLKWIKNKLVMNNMKWTREEKEYLEAVNYTNKSNIASALVIVIWICIIIFG